MGVKECLNLPPVTSLPKEYRTVRTASRVCRVLLPGVDRACLYDPETEKETAYAKRLKALSINLIRLEVYTAVKCLDKRGKYIKPDVLHRDVLVFSTLRSQDQATRVKSADGVEWDFFPVAPLHSKKSRDHSSTQWIDGDAVTPNSLEDDSGMESEESD